MPRRASLLPLFIGVTLAGATPGIGSLIGCRGPAAEDSAKVTSAAQTKTEMSTFAEQMRTAARLDDAP
jgi:hypothetical protein